MRVKFRCVVGHTSLQSISVILVQLIRDLEDAMSTISPSTTRTRRYFPSLWSALRLNFAKWRRRALSRRQTRISADIEASKGVLAGLKREPTE
jgi:hypothetical protein